MAPSHFWTSVNEHMCAYSIGNVYSRTDWTPLSLINNIKFASKVKKLPLLSHVDIRHYRVGVWGRGEFRSPPSLWGPLWGAPFWDKNFQAETKLYASLTVLNCTPWWTERFGHAICSKIMKFWEKLENNGQIFFEKNIVGGWGSIVKNLFHWGRAGGSFCQP